MAEPVPPADADADESPLSVCSFMAGGLLCGLPVEEVQEVLLDTRVTPVPRAHPAVSGLINIRGVIVPALDLRRRLQLAPRTGADEPMHVVMLTGSGPVSLLVDAIQDVTDVPRALLAPPPDNLHGVAREFVRGVLKLDGALLLLLDPAGLVALRGRS
jgi:purine-binding chemotaxis protein CheW